MQLQCIAMMHDFIMLSELYTGAPGTWYPWYACLNVDCNGKQSDGSSLLCNALSCGLRESLLVLLVTFLHLYADYRGKQFCGIRVHCYNVTQVQVHCYNTMLYILAQVSCYNIILVLVHCYNAMLHWCQCLATMLYWCLQCIVTLLHWCIATMPCYIVHSAVLQFYIGVSALLQCFIGVYSACIVTLLHWCIATMTCYIVHSALLQC